MHTSALLTRGFSRGWTVLGMLRPAGAALTVLIATTIVRRLSVRTASRRQGYRLRRLATPATAAGTLA